MSYVASGLNGITKLVSNLINAVMDKMTKSYGNRCLFIHLDK